MTAPTRRERMEQEALRRSIKEPVDCLLRQLTDPTAQVPLRERLCYPSRDKRPE
jgi:hypothetical protein